jgi:uncharacterized protein (DUF1800 family)
MTPESIALNRFGLGYAHGDNPSGDPRGWVAAQISRFSPVPCTAAKLAPSADEIAQRMADLNDIRRERNERLRNAGSDGASTVRKQTTMAVRELHADYEVFGAARMEWAAQSREPFMERMAHFWANHFAVDVSKRVLRSFAGAHETVSIRPFIAGSFADLLRHASLSPAMLLYLDQTRSVGPGSPASVRQREAGRNSRGLNENLAREILELHSLGVDGGYGQDDVVEFAKALTGWAVAEPGDVVTDKDWPAGAAFKQRIHEPGSRTILGRRFEDNGPDLAFEIIDFLATHPSTARHIATKLARHFAGDTPPVRLVDKLAKAFLSSGGDLPTVYRALIASDEAWIEQPVKFRQPVEWLAGAMRAADAVKLPPRRVIGMTRELGQPLWAPGSPAGFPDMEEAWLAPDALIRRAEVASVFAERAELPDVRDLAELMFPGSLSPSTVDALRAAASNTMAFGLLMLSPEMLRR